MAWALGVLVAGVLGGLLYYLRRGVLAGQALDAQAAQLQVEQDRRLALEAAEAEARARRAQEFDAKAAAVKSAADAAALLRDELSGS